MHTFVERHQSTVNPNIGDPTADISVPAHVYRILKSVLVDVVFAYVSKFFFSSLFSLRLLAEICARLIFTHTEWDEQRAVYTHTHLTQRELHARIEHSSSYIRFVFGPLTAELPVLRTYNIYTNGKPPIDTARWRTMAMEFLRSPTTSMK